MFVMGLLFTSSAKDGSTTPVATPESEVEPVGKQCMGSRDLHVMLVLVYRAGASGSSRKRCQVPACKVQM